MNERLDIHIHLHQADAVLAILQRIEAKMSDLSTNVDQLEADVTAETTVEQSAITLMNGLSAEIADLKGQLQNSGDIAAAIQRLTALGTVITARKQALADAIVANTPAQP